MEGRGENGVHDADGDAIARRFKPLDTSLEEELAEGGTEVLEAERQRARDLIDANLER